ncbi:MAG TPA: type II secretion system protein [Candidatus Desulfofervidus auxilii]|uniref:Type II secretion system protein n=1 Tax=Desulfofervidus auxilii TaxID=1621989 RepID=A0A7C0U3U1_DESA2|nr:type II secretion system protein [Candidatus Desulfofervidus auxilii]
MGINKLKKGFTLLEVLIALSITSILLIVLIYSLNYYLKLIQEQEIATIAYFLAKEKMSEIKNNPVKTKGFFLEPYKDYAYATYIYPLNQDFYEIGVIVKKGKYEFKIKEFIFKKN